ncbi:NAD(P)-dependent oxidoreductase [Kitasatospora sp. NPDC001540]|uniref:NAD(P)-dependent oxidoreductase n=1 Tax=Kitasatospora sp. NPDC001540 TaxID=3364014 RepID=UPI0036C3AE5B
MSRIVVFGAGGNAGRRAVAEAVSRGHRVTAVVRDAAKYRELAAEGVTLVEGDVTEAGSVAAVAAGHDAVISTVFRADVAPADFYGAVSRALVAGLAEAGVGRLVAVGVGTALEAAPGVAVHDSPEFPEEYRQFSIGHSVENEVYRASALDWVVVTPPPAVLDADAERTGTYRVGGPGVLPTEEGAPAFSYADLAVALVDVATGGDHHREVVAVG